ncbi:sensor histidine kinase [Nocardia sp. CDC160]|uniref:sensor histidine kinase n=1 Tax=Nocardia sp. CDC160 TaxID=3112166 RepID=UPI002DBAE8FC|nr:histidine kinase [Nocardia sp. CDC160]MEC3917981.1 histidine kinase [Nocardia sp. CDC160]
MPRLLFVVLFLPAALVAVGELQVGVPLARLAVEAVGVAGGVVACWGLASSEVAIVGQRKVLAGLGVLAVVVVTGMCWPSEQPIAAPAVWVAIVACGVAAARIENRADLVVVAALVALVYGAAFRFVSRSGHGDNSFWFGVTMLTTTVSIAMGLLHRAQRHDQEARRATALADVRAAMAHELHDVIAHEVIGIVVVATAAQPGVDEHARKVLRRIEKSGRRALADIRTMVGTLHQEQAPRTTYDPMDLIDGFRDTVTANVVAELDPAAGPPRVADMVMVVAHRIMAEAFNNIRRHGADATRVGVVLRLVDGVLEIEVRDNGSGVAGLGGGGGHGLAGLRDRAAAVGGTVTAGRHGSDWVVAARLPAHGRADRA